jgi:hypothetical protein
MRHAADVRQIERFGTCIGHSSILRSMPDRQDCVIVSRRENRCSFGGKVIVPVACGK